MIDRFGLLTRHRSLLVVGSGVYLALIFGFMLWRGIEIEPQWVLLALLLIAVALGRGRAFIRDWSPFLALFLAYEVMRGFADNAGFGVHSVLGLETLLFFGHLPTVVLQRALYSPSVIGPLDVITMCMYFLHFVLPLVVGFIFWISNRDHYWRYVSALLLMSYVAFVTYMFVPTAPPWWQDPHDVHKIITETIFKWHVAYFISPLYTHLNPNAFAAFPSLHAAYPALATMFAWRRYRRVALALLAWTAGLWFSIVYLGEHYFVDALAGLVYAICAFAVVNYVADRIERRRLAGNAPLERDQEPARS